MITVKKLVKRFGPKIVLRGLNLEVAAGELIALLGPNGAGKTTLLRIMSSLATPTMGVVKIDGYHLPSQAAAVRRRLGVVMHQPILYGDLTAEENLTFYGRMYGLTNFEDRISEVLKLVGLARRARDLVRTFSRGMQQRLSIGRAIMHDPNVILFDEPYTGLDQDAAAMLDKVLIKVFEQGKTIVMTSHDLARAADLATRYAILSRGVIAAAGTRDEIGAENLLNFYREAIHDR